MLAEGPDITDRSQPYIPFADRGKLKSLLAYERRHLCADHVLSTECQVPLSRPVSSAAWRTLKTTAD